MLLAGFPGTRAALWQQVGRAGRDAGDALAVLVARDDPLDTYLVTHPEALLGAPVEATVFDPANPYVVGPHLCAAAQEVAADRGTTCDMFGADARDARRRADRRRAAAAAPARLVLDRPRAAPATSPTSAPAAAARSRLVEADTGRVVGTVDGGSAHATAHAGAVYVHRGETWLVESLDLEERVAMIDAGRRGLLDDRARGHRHRRSSRARADRAWGEARLILGEVEVSPPGGVLPQAPIAGGRGDRRGAARPARAHLHDHGRVVDAARDDAARRQRVCCPADLPGAAHAAEHCSIGLLPLFATCDRWDIGGVSTALHADTGQLTVFVYDGHPGGAGFAERGFDAAATGCGATREAIAACACADGCPSCVQSPKCGNQNNPLDKAGAVACSTSCSTTHSGPGAICTPTGALTVRDRPIVGVEVSGLAQPVGTVSLDLDVDHASGDRAGRDACAGSLSRSASPSQAVAPAGDISGPGQRRQVRGGLSRPVGDDHRGHDGERRPDEEEQPDHRDDEQGGRAPLVAAAAHGGASAAVTASAWTWTDGQEPQDPSGGATTSLALATTSPSLVLTVTSAPGAT